jgi:serine/threonine protein kinase
VVGKIRLIHPHTLTCRGHSIAVDIVRGLAFFHTHNILHLDMKSPNILLNNDGAKIADIGLGKKLPEGKESVPGEQNI